ncbi:hypothetical protein CWB99_14010 [Pseudoalteromonas rubra]|uniref:Uncharacterized protein n=1 Tax=Pseudoalteromonas rubra TaxID=43658 RepID=A0A5S3WLJ6_9GAMM|nr:CRISPR-associated endonuclease Cas2 [Pseudoalteromonas rubra]TMP27798.1 hypothetical protein CWB99_14010 [Pseudoalteromonas rubra]TMP32525.1 hypothetical protein CWC00_12660 [Pseudoalteromonas rubra]
MFEIDTTSKQLIKLQRQLKELLKPNDKAHLFPLCGKCMGNRKADGAGQVTWPERFYYY